MVPGSAATRAHGGAQAAAGGQGATPAPKTRQRASVAPTLADLQVLWGGRDRLLKIAEVAEHLGVCNATVYRLCDSGELPHVWIVNRSGSGPPTCRRSWSGRPLVASPATADGRLRSDGGRIPRWLEVARRLAVDAGDGELPHVRMNNPIRIRPSDLQEFIAARVTIPEKPRRHRPKPSE